MAKKMELYV